ncbi:MAG TPA: hypothetical protein VF669_04350 [Tepidisphaeraceae bacterium]|jgi:hypothetical protein
MHILNEARALLDGAGFQTTASPDQQDLIYFEDHSILGFLAVHSRVEDVLKAWEEMQDRFLKENALPLRTDPTKIWNIYSVHLTSASCPTELRSRLFAVEEDFRGTRKVARATIVTREDLANALLCLLPIQRLVSLRLEDVFGQLRQRLTTINPLLGNLLADTAAEEIAQKLMDRL